ncbi:MAG: hypothetical protein A3D44_02225 [Candidatus Staskawiczbacteria bacterium RIFCSPHIGHO2_02_FULL_42_22]|uniref:Uncharacterized protein n=1 Tax=Candidatus Staskawiczbacteria bacterium RIFCSPHIGHO2_02_FULL_42_22 TaxID=1802207 RepID=A0A1G2I2Y4_9BACT|nr:MAG: hypothetical protein A3D44_02225 [Candidatus Staskawiczbacteria bacterium RIFCSPHIGHO2_02_FULL_42_22]
MGKFVATNFPISGPSRQAEKFYQISDPKSSIFVTILNTQQVYSKYGKGRVIICKNIFKFKK